MKRVDEGPEDVLLAWKVVVERRPRRASPFAVVGHTERSKPNRNKGARILQDPAST